MQLFCFGALNTSLHYFCVHKLLKYVFKILYFNRNLSKKNKVTLCDIA